MCNIKSEVHSLRQEAIEKAANIHMQSAWNAFPWQCNEHECTRTHYTWHTYTGTGVVCLPLLQYIRLKMKKKSGLNV